MAMFKAFKPSGMEKIARSMGYQGNMQGFQNFLSQDPMKQQQMQQYTNQAIQMARGGVVKMQQGGTRGDDMVKRATDPAVPTGGVTVAAPTPSEAGQYVDPATGQLTTPSPVVGTTLAGTTTAADVTPTDANTFDASKSGDEVEKTLKDTEAAQGDVDPRSQVDAQEQKESSIKNLKADQGEAYIMDNPVQRELDSNELVEPTFNAEKAAKFAEQIQAAEATPSKQATVQGQLETLMQGFEGGNTPAWAAGAMRQAMAGLAERGLGASSLAGQAAIQAAMESALPIAQADASTFAQFESQNLSNRQQRVMLAAEQRASFIGQEFDQAFQARVMNASKVSDIANMNFNAEQQVALENSRAVNSMNMANLNNRQALVMAEAAALSQLDMANLNNRQQAAVMNSQAFLQMDMANLSNQQQTNMFKAQSRIQSLFTDQAAENAARQFNASSQNQIDQYFAGLASQVSQFNATQANAQAQFNAGQINTVERFNAEINNSRDQFNAQNQLVIAQNNAQWRRQIATADTAAVNRANELNAAAILDVSKTAYDNLWQYYADTMEWAWTSSENSAERLVQMAMAELDAKVRSDLGKLKIDADESGAIGGFFMDLFTSPLGGSFLGGLFGK